MDGMKGHRPPLPASPRPDAARTVGRVRTVAGGGHAVWRPGHGGIHRPLEASPTPSGPPSPKGETPLSTSPPPNDTGVTYALRWPLCVSPGPARPAFDPATAVATAANEPPHRPAVMPAVGSPFANTNLNQVVWPRPRFGPDQGPMHARHCHDLAANCTSTAPCRRYGGPPRHGRLAR